MDGAHLVRVNIEQGEHGLFYATSPDLKALFVADTDRPSLMAALAEAMRLLSEARSELALPLTGAGVADCDDVSPWVTIPAHIVPAGKGHNAGQ